MKRLLSAILILALFLSLIPLTAAAGGQIPVNGQADPTPPSLKTPAERSTPSPMEWEHMLSPQSGKCGENLTWSYDPREGSLVIEGTGAMYDYSDSYYEETLVPWAYMVDWIIHVRVGEGVTYIGAYAFSGLRHLMTLSLPQSLKTIGSYGIQGTGLSELILPDGLETLEDHAVSNNLYLQELTLPKALTYLGVGAIDNNDGMTLKVDPENRAFTLDSRGNLYSYDMTSLYKIRERITHPFTVPETVKRIEGHAFCWQADMPQIILPQGLTYIGESAFEGCDGLAELVLPDSLREIGPRAFWGCFYLKNVTFPTSLEIIGENAFSYCRKIEELNLPTGLKEIRDYAFYTCEGLTALTLPEGVESLGDFAFESCKNLKQISIPSTTRELGASALADTALEQITVDENNPYLFVDEQMAVYRRDPLTLLHCPPEVAGAYTFPQGLVEIGPMVFSGCSELTEMTLPDTVRTIGEGAFGNCRNLTKITLPASLEVLGEGAFAQCYSLKAITLPQGLTSVGDSAFAACESLEEISLPDSIRDLGENVFDWCTGLRKVKLPASLKVLPKNLFECCVALEEVTLPPVLETIGAFAFVSCESLQEVVLPETLKEIQNKAFLGCVALTAVDLPEGLHTVGEYAFNGCLTLERVSVPSTVKCLPSTSFSFCENLKAFLVSPENPCLASDEKGAVYSKDFTVLYSVPQALEGHYPVAPTTRSLGPRAFSGCTRMTSVSLPLGLEEICNFAFQYCYELREVTVPATVRELGAAVFWYTEELTGVYFDGDAPKTGLDPLRDSSLNAKLYCYEDRLGWTFPMWEDCPTAVRQAPEKQPVSIMHALNLESDLSINYAVLGASLEGCDSYYMMVRIPMYNDNGEVCSERSVALVPEMKEGFCYFTLTGITALQMNDELRATLYMVRDGETYASQEDRYSVATYACNQLNKPTVSDELKTLCANLLQYGGKAQLYKGYRTQSLADSRLTAEAGSYLTELSTVTFGNTDRVLTDLEAPEITWVGQTLDLQSKVVVRYVIDASAYEGAPEDLSLVITYRDIKGNEILTRIREPQAYSSGEGHFAFDFAELRAADLRAVLSGQIYAGEEPVSQTLLYSVDTYCNGKTGELDTLCRALLAYSDAAKAFFA